MLAQELHFEEELIVNKIKATKVGGAKVNKDFLSPTKGDSFVKRGVNSLSCRSVVIWNSFIAPEILQDIQQGINNKI